ncbi:aldo/keto reductase [Duganella sp. BJB1802]|uniref:aldo/keto reductase n=1 Tax=Duganella sp. BJB1802 TaxID=2744575 RepID=UPI0015943F19|nr:aldo/keto reductase [Duganella sp. BJB1802]NVD69531.1 aldo/keto reductase [Duganella sp. BJB1802]
MKQRKLGSGGLQVSAVGLGCMGMSFAYGGGDSAESIRTMHRAVDLGVTFFDTAEVYGPYVNEELVGKAVRSVRDKVQIATKFGFRILPHGEGLQRMAGVDSRPEHIREAVTGSLQRLGIETIDLLYQHRPDPSVPVEEVVGVMAELVREGKVRHLGLSEVSAATVRRAHAVHPIAAVQSEYSLWSRDPERQVLPVCRELGIGFVPYSPLGRGFLTGALTSAEGLAQDDFRRTLPRFQEAAMRGNLALIHQLRRLADGHGVTLAQLALAWLLHQGEDIVPIPGARQLGHLEENCGAAEIVLGAADLADIAALFDEGNVQGARYAQGDFDLLEN